MAKQEQRWEIERVDRYWHYATRYCKRYVEVTFWYDPISLERKETKRETENHGHIEHLPDWAKSITEHMEGLDNY